MEQLTILKRMCYKSAHIHQQPQSIGQNIPKLNEEETSKVLG